MQKGVLVIFAVVLAAMLALCAVAVTSNCASLTRAVGQGYGDIARGAASISAGIAHGDDIETYLSTLEKDELYEKTLWRLEIVRSSFASVRRIYVFTRVSPDEIVVVFCLPSPGEADYTLGDHVNVSEYAALWDGESTVPFSRDGGASLTAIYPVYDARGARACYVGVDVSMQGAKDERNASLRRLSYTLLLLVAIFIACGATLHIAFTRRQTGLRKQADISARRAEKAGRAREEFFLRMSREVRTPLNAVMEFHALAAQNADNPDAARDYLKKADGASHALQCVVNDILDLSQLENNAMRYEETPFELKDLLAPLRAAFCERCAERGLTLRVSAEGVAEESLLGDALRIRQALRCLLDNAVRRADTGCVLLRVTQDEARSGVARTRFEVRDTGRGSDDGTDLGLAVARQLTNLMRGTLDAQTDADKGASYTMELPLGVAPGRADTDAYANMRCLIVSRDAATRRDVSDMAKRLGAICAAAQSAQEALALMEWADASGAAYSLCLAEECDDTADFAARIAAISTPPTLVMLTNSVPPASAEGAVRVVQLPLFRSTMEEIFVGVTGRKPRDARPDAPSHDFTGHTVLLVEDERINREATERLIAATGARVESVPDGRAAVERLARSAENEFDMVLMDLHMPVMDGYEATRRIRMMRRGDMRVIPILALTADVAETSEAAAVAAGMDAFLPKPCDVDMLYNAMRKHFAR